MARRSVFISYAHADRPDVEDSAALLRAGGVRVFIDVRDIDYGERWQAVLKSALDKCERVMVFWSLAAQASEWVEREWRYALALGKRIVPTLLDRTPLPAELAQFQAVQRFRRAEGVPARSQPDPARPRAPEADAFYPQAPRAAPRRVLIAGAVAVAIAAIGGGVALWTLQAPQHPPSSGSPTTVSPHPPAQFDPPASTPAPPRPTPGPAPAPPPQLQRQGMLDPGPMALVTAAAAALAALVAWWRRRGTKAVSAEAAAFVREVFEA